MYCCPVVITFTVPPLMVRSLSVLRPLPPAPVLFSASVPASIVKVPSHLMPAQPDTSLSSYTPPPEVITVVRPPVIRMSPSQDRPFEASAMVWMFSTPPPMMMLSLAFMPCLAFAVMLMRVPVRKRR